VIARALTSLRLRALDARDALSGRDALVPPRRRQFVGAGDFVAVGDEFLGHFRALAGLEPGHRVLDIGCGIGRMARPLTGFLDPARGSYDGFDVNRAGIEWCRARYAAYPHFRFRAVDLFNTRYRPDAGASARDFRFPYADGAFDLVFATSVFTHLLREDADRYLAESARVLAPGGRLLATFFLRDGDAPAPALDFRPLDDVTAVVDPQVPEEAVAFDARWLAERLADHGLGAPETHPGTWRGRAGGRSYQDIVVAARA
jgi:SAM-dependent methyltransferase